jgi:zona occludens toxin
MLTIVTGTPGAGKTLFTLDRILKESVPEKGKPRREIFVHNVADLDLKFFNAQVMTDPEKWYELPHGSLLVFDEAQGIFPQRTKDEKPLKVEKFATHRHSGYDIFIVTQDPMNVDVFIRRMAGRHFHLRRILNRGIATVYEYQEYQSNPTGFLEKQQAIAVFSWKHNRKLFDRYRSATIHTHKARFPLKLLIIPVALLVCCIAFWRAFVGLTSMSEPVNKAAVSAAAAAAPTVPSVDFSKGLARGVISSIGPYLDSFAPVVPGLAHSAPVYQELFVPVTFPKPLCIEFQIRPDSSATRCKCFTQQLTRYDTSDQNCRFWVDHGWFDPTREDLDSARGQAERPRADPAVQAGSVPPPAVIGRAVRGIVEPVEDRSVKVYEAAHKVVRQQPYVGYGDSK